MYLSTVFWHVLPLLPYISHASSVPKVGGISYKTSAGRKVCTVTANGGNQSDVSNILTAFGECGKGGDIVFPEGQNYWIDRKLNPVVDDVQIEWKGIWTVGSPSHFSSFYFNP